MVQLPAFLRLREPRNPELAFTWTSVADNMSRTQAAAFLQAYLGEEFKAESRPKVLAVSHPSPDQLKAIKDLIQADVIDPLIRDPRAFLSQQKDEHLQKLSKLTGGGSIIRVDWIGVKGEQQVKYLLPIAEITKPGWVLNVKSPNYVSGSTTFQELPPAAELIQRRLTELMPLGPRVGFDTRSAQVGDHEYAVMEIRPWEDYPRRISGPLRPQDVQHYARFKNQAITAGIADPFTMNDLTAFVGEAYPVRHAVLQTPGGDHNWATLIEEKTARLYPREPVTYGQYSDGLDNPRSSSRTL